MGLLDLLIQVAGVPTVKGWGMEGIGWSIEWDSAGRSCPLPLSRGRSENFRKKIGDMKEVFPKQA